MFDYLAHSAKLKDGIPEQSYEKHVSEVRRMAFENVVKVAAFTKYKSMLMEAVEYAALYHDLGKLDTDNQKVLKQGKGSLPHKHWDAGAAHLLARQKSIARNLSALFVYSHHIGLPSLPGEAAKGTGRIFRETGFNSDGRSFKTITDERLDEYIKAHDSVFKAKPEAPKERNDLEPTTLAMRMALSCLVDADHTDTARHYQNVVPEGEIPLLPAKRLDKLDRYVAGLSMKADKKRLALRQAIYKACRNAIPSEKGMIACDSPVGSGKTTAIMAHLLNVAKTKELRRIFVVLPFTNIIDQSVEVYRNALALEVEKGEKVVAAHHHKAEFDDLETRAFSFLWNAPITVTTAVQFFETLASNHPATLRKLHQLAGSGIFIDEAHAALPPELWPQAWKWLEELVEDWGCYIVLGSGSLTRFWEMEEFSTPPVHLPELIQEDVRKAALAAERNRIIYRSKDENLTLEKLCGWITHFKGPRLVILNTVQSAAVVARELAGPKNSNKQAVEHLSTALAPMHRKAIIERVKKRLENKSDNNWTLVATSCVEAGVDFSFRTAMREFCSLVSTIQTAGRINRSGEYGSVELWNFNIDPGDLLKKHPKFQLSSRILADLYKEKKIFSEYCKDAMQREIREANFGLGQSNIIVTAERNKDFPEVNDKFRVIDSNTVTVVVDSDLMDRIECHEKTAPSELQQKTINIYHYLIETYALKPLAGHRGLYGWTLAYDEAFLGYMAGVITILNHHQDGTII